MPLFEIPPVAEPVPAPRIPVGVSATKVLIIGIDGLRWDRLAEADVPRLRSLSENGLFAPSRLDLTAGAQTLSGPGWSTFATGVLPDRHGVRDNTFAGKRYDRYPDFLTRLKRANPGLSTYAAVDWPPLFDEGTFGPLIDGRVLLDGEEEGYLAQDARLVEVSARVLRHGDPDAAFVYLGSVDIVGHATGAMSREYLDMIAIVDLFVGQLLDAVSSRPGYLNERWLVLIGTDHGHLDTGGHGGFTDAERRTFIIAHGPGIPAGHRRADSQLVDLAPTVLAHLGVAVDPSWGWRGRSLLTHTVPSYDAGVPISA